MSETRSFDMYAYVCKEYLVHVLPGSLVVMALDLCYQAV